VQAKAKILIGFYQIMSLLLLCVIIGEIMEVNRCEEGTLWNEVTVHYYCHPKSLSRTIIGAMKCRAYKTDDASNEYRSYLVFSMDMECDGNSDKNCLTLMRIFWVFFILWPYVVPLLLLLLLTKVYRSVKENRPTQLANTRRFLWEDFDETSIIALHWDIIDT